MARVCAPSPLVLLSATVLAAGQQPKRTPDIHFVPTPEEVVEAMLRLAEVDKNDVVYDLGSGDGRIPITAARRFGARGVGIDLDPKLVAQATRSAQEAGVADRVRFIEGDIFEADISAATVVTLYLLTSINERLRPKLLKELRARHAHRVASIPHGRLGARPGNRRRLPATVSLEGPEALIRFIARRLLLTVPVLAGVATLVFSLIHLVPGDPVQAMLGESASREDVVDLRHRLGLDRPLYVQYAAFLRGAVTGDLGRSLAHRAKRHGSDCGAHAGDLRAGVRGNALRRSGRRAARASLRRFGPAPPWITAPRRSPCIGISLPGFWLGPILAIVFAVTLGWLPVSGRGTPAHLVLPAITLGAPLAAVLARMTRASVLEELRELYVLAARARGVSRGRAGTPPCVSATALCRS